MNTGRTQTKCIVNLSTKKYWKGQERLIKSLEGNTDADLLMFKSEEEVGAPLHKDNMYSFKTYAIEEAFKKGYAYILWLDASMYVIKDLNPIFEEIEKQGYFAQDSGWLNNRFTTPEQKEYFGTDEGKMISSGFVGFNTDDDMGYTLLDNWHQASLDGMFHFNHHVSRQDQTALSLIIEYWKLKITPNNTFWNYGKEPLHENILTLADGIV